MFRPQTPGSLSQSPYGAQYPSQSTASSTPPPPRPNAAYATPPIATGPPSNRYAPQQSTQPNNAIPPAGPAGRGIMPPPTNHAYAPPPAQTPYGQPPQQIYPPPHQAQGPPPMAGPPMTGPPPMAGPPQGPPPRGSSTTGSRPEIGSSHPPPPKSATPAQKYPKGDRSHIPEHSRLLFEILEEEMQRVTTNAPPDYQTQVQQLGKRLSAFLDHLNNDDLLTQDTVGALTTAFVHVRNKNFAEASNVYSNVPQQELGGFGAVHKKLIQLSEFAQQ
ncbi:hypothetical protein DRE_03204 [Drechslerella stenobrocha 248]|uniref:SRA1/Sec31 domain-containing protein n=1 Tax=Drechslerella stenobrocha 248 TaxID=1043628 RepID=W7HVP6_9PEZI|nr:hypothetical protein DRE_03204 [Drechslerella stenobrocha 248]